MEKRERVLIFILIILIVTVFFVNICNATVKTDQKLLVTIMLYETDLREALKEISMQTGVTIVADGTVSGVVTADFKKVPLEEALKVILSGGGYSFRKINDFYLVGLPDPENTTFSKLSEIKVVELQHLTSRDVFNLLPSFLNHYVKGNGEDNLLTISAPPEELKRIYKFIKKLDQPEKQVEIEVVMTEIDAEEIKEIGINLLNYNEDETANEKFSYSSEDNLIVLENDVSGKLITKLKMLEEENKAKIEADPRVVVADGEEAKLFIGEEQTLLINEYYDEDNDSWTEEIEVGVGLEVTPHILGNNEIKLKISPEISHFVDRNTSDIIVKENTLSTTIRMKNKQTLVLAGMTMQDDSSSKQKVPVLGDIPLVRWLFSNIEQSKADRKFLVFVTPTIKD